METIELVPPVNGSAQKKYSPFIEANTVETTMAELNKEHIIPVFAKDNEPLVSHQDFVLSVCQAFENAFPGLAYSNPEIRVSHPIKGRIPEARHKQAKDLEDWEKTIYYERMMFAIYVPGITINVGGNQLMLTVGGVKAYNHDNLHGKSGTLQNFKVFIGFRNMVCTNLCVNSDGYLGDVKCQDIEGLVRAVTKGYSQYGIESQVHQMEAMTNVVLSEHQFSMLIGRCKIYQHLDIDQREGIPPLHFGDHHLNTVCRDYFNNSSFSRMANGSISLWSLYNLFTGSNKNSYIDKFLQRSENATGMADHIHRALAGDESWYLNF